MSLRLAFAGTPQFAVPALDALAASAHKIVGVLTQPDRAAGRGRKFRSSAVKTRAQELGLEVSTPDSLRAAAAREHIAALNIDALVVVAYGLLIPEDILALPRLGAYNIHSSLLPRWRGAAPIQRCVLAGDALSGITIMQMDSGLDTGPILMREEVPLQPRETSGSLQAKLAPLGARMMAAALDALASGTARVSPQPLAGMTYAAKLRKSEAPIDWRRSAADIDRQVRAFNPAPVAQTRLGERQLRVWSCDVTAPDGLAARPGTVVAHDARGASVACGRGVLRLEQVQWAGGNIVHAGELSNSKPLAGALLESP